MFETWASSLNGLKLAWMRGVWMCWKGSQSDSWEMGFEHILLNLLEEVLSAGLHGGPAS